MTKHDRLVIEKLQQQAMNPLRQMCPLLEDSNGKHRIKACLREKDQHYITR